MLHLAKVRLWRWVAAGLLMAAGLPHATQAEGTRAGGVRGAAADGRVAVVVVEGLDAAQFRAALQGSLDFPVVPLTDSRATATSRRLLLVVDGGTAVFSLEDVGETVWTEVLRLPPGARESTQVRESLVRAAVPLLVRASSPLFRRAELIDPFGQTRYGAVTFDTSELLDPFGAVVDPGVGSSAVDVFAATELLNPFEGDEPSLGLSESAPTLPATPGRDRVRSEGAHGLGRPRPGH